MKKIFFLLTFSAAILILSSCAPQNQLNNNEPGQTNQPAPTSKGNLNSSDQPKNLNAVPTENTNSQPGVTKEELDKLKADINKLQSDNPNGLSQ